MDDLKHIGEIPCARNSLLAGIASGFGIGVIRGINTSAFLVFFFRISFEARRLCCYLASCSISQFAVFWMRDPGLYDSALYP